MNNGFAYNTAVLQLLVLTSVAFAISCGQPTEPPRRNPNAPAGSLSSLRIEQPTDRAVFQRDERGMAEIPVACAIAVGKDDAVEMCAMDLQTRQVTKDWTAVANDAKDGTFRARLPLPAGWYRVAIRVQRAGAVAATSTVEHVGIGEVFVTCGQSNSANYGQPPQRAQDDRVSSCDFQTGRWRNGNDPQPGAGGDGGSPWPVLGDLLAKKLNVPVGFICVGVGSTLVTFWTPPGKGYARIRTALQLAGPRGVRAVLWHQGESDSIAGTSAENYARMLGRSIKQSRQDAGWSVPWGVALVSFHPSDKASPARQLEIVAGQKKVIAEVPCVFQGPETDSFHKRNWLCDSVHFNAKGLAAHAQGWVDALEPLFQELSTQHREEQKQ